MAATNTNGARAANARKAAEKADARREQAEGLGGWVAERAGDWDLEDNTSRLMETQ